MSWLGNFLAKFLTFLGTLFLAKRHGRLESTTENLEAQMEEKERHEEIDATSYVDNAWSRMLPPKDKV